MNRFKDFLASTVGKKTLMALTGFVMVGFLLGHMAGNLKFFGGFDQSSGLYKIDHYAQFLREIGQDLLGHEGFLWIFRAVLLGSVIVHVLSALQLRAINLKARPVEYAVVKYRASNLASRTMYWGGLLIALFIVVHILHFTTGTLHLRGFAHGRVYANLYAAFSVWYISLFYVICMLAIGAHLFHGTWSLCQTLGIDRPAWNKTLRTVAKLLAVIVFFGFITVPLSISFGCMPAPHAEVSMNSGQGGTP